MMQQTRPSVLSQACLIPPRDAAASTAAPRMPADALGQRIHRQLQACQLGLQTPAGFMPVPVSLTPWQLSAAQFNRARQLAQLLGRLQATAAAHPDWLLSQLDGLQHSQSVPGQIWRTLRSLYPLSAEQTAERVAAEGANLMLNRHDFLLDQQQQWRWVESNPIAAGMGPLNARYLALLQAQLPQEQPDAFASNDAITAQAALLAQAALSRALLQQTATRREPLMLIVVDAAEDNIFDQQLLCAEVQRSGISVVRVTVSQLLQSEFDGRHQLFWQAQQVDLIYWRTGYNPSAELNENYWRFRARLEQAAVTQCPNLAGQLTGSKWFQHRFTSLLLDNRSGLAAQFDIPATEVALLRPAVVPSVAVSDLTPATAQQRIAEGYWYKTQQEGGGNVARGQAALQKSARPDVADLLMAPIDAAWRREAVSRLRHGELTVATEHISELGIFSLGAQADYGGYLCRTKPAQSNEGGVHRGGAVLDTIRFSRD